jgi:quinoprotein glucose dehydrogenase
LTDLAGQPLLVEISRPEGRIPAVVQVTKQGDVYFLDRRTGVPIFPVTETPAPQGVAAGDRLSPTQPSSQLVAGDTQLAESEMWGLTPLDQMACRIQFRNARHDGRYTPPGLNRRTLIHPGFTGVSDWGGLSADPTTNVAILNTTNFVDWLRLVPRAEVTPELEAAAWTPMMKGTPYAVEMGPMMGPMGVPCNAPPWGELEAIDLNTGRRIWRRWLGTGRDSGPFGVPSMLPLPMGVPNLGGAVTTGSGIVFIGATVDRYLRAFDVTTGRELWKARLPAGGQATPMTYMAGGRQYVVITAQGNAHLGTTRGDYTIAYALPERAGAGAEGNPR